MSDERQQKINNVLAEGAVYGRTLLKNALERAGVELTGELINSVAEITKGLANRYEPEIVFEFREYMRYKDMKTLTYNGYTNTEAIVKFVKKVGINSFAYVSGREGSPSGIANAESKIAWAILKSRRQNLTVNHQKNKRVYNSTKMLLFNKIRRDIQAINAEEGMQAIKAALIGG
jgi:hypothetical protein